MKYINPLVMLYVLIANYYRVLDKLRWYGNNMRTTDDWLYY